MFAAIKRKGVNGLDKLKWKMQQFMMGRNGQDELARTILIASLVLYVLTLFTGSAALNLVSWLGLVYTMFRCLSRNIAQRRSENEKFLSEQKFWKMKYQQRKTHKIFKCKGCGKTMRVPKGKGKLEITCPVCGTKTIRKS